MFEEHLPALCGGSPQFIVIQLGKRFPEVTFISKKIAFEMFFKPENLQVDPPQTDA